MTRSANSQDGRTAKQAKAAPKASIFGLDFVLHTAEFTKKAVARHGHVWEVHIAAVGPSVYGLAGAEGLQAFYDPQNIARYPAADSSLLLNLWTSNGFPGLPPLDGEGFLRRKNNFLTLTTWDAAEKLLQATDQPIVEALQHIGRDGSTFSYWDFSNRLILGLYSKQWFGLGIEDWNGGKHAADIVVAVQDAFAIFGDKHLTHRPQELAKIMLTDYFQAALAALRSQPKEHGKALLAAYLQTPESQKLNDDELIMDMFQMLVTGTYGLLIQGNSLMYRLLKHPKIRAKIAAEISNIQEPLTIKTLLAQKYTEAFVKETLRWYPAVFALAGHSTRDFVVEGKLVPAGVKVLACLYGTCHDPTVFEDPESFDPERHLPPRSEGPQAFWNDYSVVFGAGNNRTGHSCAGKWLAMAHLLHITIRLVQNWNFEMADDSEQIEWPRFEPHPENGLMLQRVPLQ
ncbi:hypothetical protein WJX74_007457 [Apatococcus lobatus]|uniref:Cytochrome P450 n=1 Tax=Apatococcus lobatus TaxID=904363 RepID=A0AAW1RT01_9CHLO